MGSEEARTRSCAEGWDRVGRKCYEYRGGALRDPGGQGGLPGGESLCKDDNELRERVLKECHRKKNRGEAPEARYSWLAKGTKNVAILVAPKI